MWFALAVAYIIAAVLAYGVVARLPLRSNFLFKFLACGGLFWVGLAIHEVAVYGATILTLAALLLFAFVWELYIFLFAMISTSVSVGLLRRVNQAPVSAEQIVQRYSTEFMVESRLDRLVTDGYLRPDGGSYSLTPRAEFVLNSFNILRSFFRHPQQPPVLSGGVDPQRASA